MTYIYMYNKYNKYKNTMENKTQQEIANALENIQHALEYPDTGEVYGQTVATSLEQIAGVMFEIRDALIKIANKD